MNHKLAANLVRYLDALENLILAGESDAALRCIMSVKTEILKAMTK